MIYIAPTIKAFVGDDNGFSVTDFALSRFGRCTQLIVAFMSTMYLFISLCAEISTIATVATVICGVNMEHEFTRRVVITTVCAITLSNTMLSGLPASILTDRLQGVMIVCFMLLFSIFLFAENPVPSSAMNAVSNSTTSGFTVMVTLILAVLSAELFNAGQ